MALTSFPDANVSKPSRPQHLRDMTMERLLTDSAAVATDEQPQQNAPLRLAFDPETALARVEGDRDLLRRMVGLFAMQWRKLTGEIAKAGQDHDGPTLELTANKLRQSVGSFGAGEASRAAQELEARGCKSDFHAVEKTCARLKMEIERLVKDLREFTK
jgi:hypothetical protein